MGGLILSLFLKEKKEKRKLRSEKKVMYSAEFRVFYILVLDMQSSSTIMILTNEIKDHK